MRNCRVLAAEDGYAFMWTLFLVAMLGLGLGSASEVYQTSIYRDQEKELLTIGRQFRQAIGDYYETQLTAGRREYPATLDELLKDSRFPGIRRHLRKVFVDPATGKAEWGLWKVGGRIVGVYSLSDRQPIKTGGFEADEAMFAGKEKLSEWVFVYPQNLLVQKTPDLPGQPAAPVTPPGQAIPLGGVNFQRNTQ